MSAVCRRHRIFTSLWHVLTLGLVGVVCGKSPRFTSTVYCVPSTLLSVYYDKDRRTFHMDEGVR